MEEAARRQNSIAASDGSGGINFSQPPTEPRPFESQSDDGDKIDATVEQIAIIGTTE